MSKAVKPKEEENPKLPPHLEAFKKFKEKVEEIEKKEFKAVLTDLKRNA